MVRFIVKAAAPVNARFPLQTAPMALQTAPMALQTAPMALQTAPITFLSLINKGF
jgi:hypothetical protein